MKKTLLWMIPAFLFLSCSDLQFLQEKEISLGSGKHKPYVYCVLKPDSIARMELRWSVNAGDDSYPSPIYNARPVIFRNSVPFDTLLLHGSRFIGKHPVPLSGSYQLIVEIPGFGSIKAETMFPPLAASIRSLYSALEPTPNVIVAGDSSHIVYLSARFPASEGFYVLQISSGSRPADWTSQHPIAKQQSNNGILDNQRAANVTGAVFFTNEAVGDSLLQLRLWISEYNVKFTEYQVDLLTLSQDLYNYHLSLRNQYENLENPFSEPIPVTSNIEGGFGVFGAERRDKWGFHLSRKPIRFFFY
jgi:hypothetical protein